VREELRASLLKYPGGDFSIGNRKRQAHRATHAPAHFHLVNIGRLRGIKEFECGVRQERQDHAAALRTLPLFDHSEAKAIAVELNGLVKVLNRQDNTYFTDRIKCCHQDIPFVCTTSVRRVLASPVTDM
jgi:hypothetical protein